MCLSSDELLLGPLIDFILAASERMCWHARALVVGQESKQIWRDGTSRARLLDLCAPLSEAHDRLTSSFSMTSSRSSK